MERTARGRRAEDLAAAYLENRGMRIAARNWRRREAELDLVADDAGVCVFVEVRSRTGTERGHPLETVTAQKRGQMVRAARLYMHEAAPRAKGYRFDVVGVIFSADGQSEPECVHVPDAFRLEGR